MEQLDEEINYDAFPHLRKYFPHRPPHRYSLKGTYFITVATYAPMASQARPHHFSTPERLSTLQTQMIEVTRKHNWTLKAWAIVSNHYHLIMENLDQPNTLPIVMQKIQGVSSRYVNQLDNTLGRKVWYQYWDTLISYRNSYFTRLKYIMENPVKHGLVQTAKDYRWCSAWWFEQFASKEYRKLLLGYKTK